jgi:hypothetical protein
VNIETHTNEHEIERITPCYHVVIIECYEFHTAGLPTMIKTCLKRCTTNILNLLYTRGMRQKQHRIVEIIRATHEEWYFDESKFIH